MKFLNTKYPTILLMMVCATCLLITPSYAQQRDYIKGTTEISFGYGGSFTGRYFNNEDFGEEASPNVTPVYSFNIDNNAEEFFSLGLATSYQRFRIDYEDLEWYDQRDSSYVVSTFYEQLSRTNIALRGIAHFNYGKSRTKIVPYIGLRMGFSLWRHHHTSPDPDWEDLELDRSWISLQGVFGAKGFFTKNIGAHLELGLGTPYLWSFGLNFRFGKGTPPPPSDSEPQVVPDYFDQ